MSSPASDEDDQGAAGDQSMLLPERPAADLLADLTLEEAPAEMPRWSLGVGWRDPEDPPPPGITVTRRGRRERLWQEGEETDVSEKPSTAPRYEGERGVSSARRSRATPPPAQPMPAQPPALAPGWGAPAIGVVPGRRPLPPLDVKFGGKPRDLGFFLVQVGSYMAEFEREFTSEAAKVRCVTRTLEGTAADWVVTLYNENSPQLRSLDVFMTALRRRFEDPLAERRARIRMKTLVQGGRSVADYTQEFRQLAYHIRGWSQGALVEAYKDGLNEDVYHTCISRRDPHDLQSWYLLAEEVDIDLTRSRRRRGPVWGKPLPPRFRETPKTRKGGTMERATSTACFRCGKEGHRMAECRAKLEPSRAKGPGRRPGNPPTKPRETGLKVGEVVEVAPPEGEGLGPPTLPDESETDSEDDVPVSPTQGPMTIQIKLRVPTSGTEGEMLALLDSGCTRCLISMKVVEGMGIGLRTLRTPISFCQLDGSEAGGCPARFVTEPLEMTMGAHRETLSFVVAPGMDRPLILGLPWLEKWNPLVNWRGKWIRIHPDQPPEGEEQPYPDGEEEYHPSHQVPTEAGSVGAERLEGEEKIPKEYWDLREVFSEEASDELPPHRSTDCSIEFLPGVKLPKPKLYSMTPGELEELRAFIDKNLKRGFITPARPRVAAPVMFREKKDGSKRLVVDYRNLNAVSVENVYPLPLMKDMLSHLAKGRIFTKLDLREAYYRIRIKEGDEWKTAFNCPMGCFQFNVLPFGLQGAPAVFMQMINQVLHEHLYKGVLVYLDDILIYTETKDEHVKLVRSVLHKLRAAKLYAKLSKCEFHQEKNRLLGVSYLTRGY